jgi:hypothetical protein
MGRASAAERTPSPRSGGASDDGEEVDSIGLLERSGRPSPGAAEQRRWRGVDRGGSRRWTGAGLDGGARSPDRVKEVAGHRRPPGPRHKVGQKHKIWTEDLFQKDL